MAGPIVRFRQVEADLEKRWARSTALATGRRRRFFTFGMIKKVLLADTLAAMINPLFDYLPVSTSGWLAMLGYTYQLYFDFSGYSDMAVGLGYLLGIRLPQNFTSPYKAVDIVTSGGAGTSHSRAVCAIICIFRSEAIARHWHYCFATCCSPC